LEGCRNEVRGNNPLCGGRTDWNENWLEVAKFFCVVDDELSDWMDRCIETILGVNYGQTIKKDQCENLRILWERVSQDEIWKELGGFYTLDEKEILLSLLCRVEERANRQNGIPSEGKEIQERPLFGLWTPIESRNNGGSSQGRQHQEQLARKFTDLVPSMPYETALEVAKMWSNLSFAYSSMNAQEARMGDITISKSKHRVEQLKAYGNAIVPEVAVEIMRAIKSTHSLTKEG
jgi:hypothetical protein